MPEAKSKCNGLISSAGEISRQPIVDAAMWFFVTTLKQAYSEDEQEGQKKYRVYSLREREQGSKQRPSLASASQVPAFGPCLHCDDAL